MTDEVLHAFEAETTLIERVLSSIEDCEQYIEPTIVLVPPFAKQFMTENFNVFFGLILCFPLGLIMRMIPFGSQRHIFSFLAGASLLQFTWGTQWIHTLITSLAVYALFLVVPRQKVQIFIPIFLLFYLAVVHFHHQYRTTDYLAVDVSYTCSQMIITQKLYMMAWNLYDGRQILDTAASSSSSSTKTTSKCTSSTTQNSRQTTTYCCSDCALVELPGLLEYLGYTFCFATVLTGPSYEFSYYRNACDGSLLYKRDGTSRGKIPTAIWPTLRPLLWCMGILFVNAILEPIFKYPKVAALRFFRLPLHHRVLFNWGANLTMRMKVYFAWFMAEGANNIWYAGFEGFDVHGEIKGWDVAKNADVWNVEVSTTIRDATRGWNKKTSLWLLRYVYLRSSKSLALVFLVSAFWHGFYPGYYLLGATVVLMTYMERMANKKLLPHIEGSSRLIRLLYKTVYVVFIHLLSSYAISAFFLRSATNVYNNWKAFYFLGHIGCFSILLIASILPTKKHEIALQPTPMVDSEKERRKDL